MFFYTFMPKLLNMSLTASVAIVLVILLRLLLKKAPKVISMPCGSGSVSSPVSGVDWFKLLHLQSFRCPSPRVWNNYQRHRICPSNIVYTEYPLWLCPFRHQRCNQRGITARTGTVGCRSARSSNVHRYLCLDDWCIGHDHLQHRFLYPAATQTVGGCSSAGQYLHRR